MFFSARPVKWYDSTKSLCDFLPPIDVLCVMQRQLARGNHLNETLYSFEKFEKPEELELYSSRLRKQPA